MFESTWIDVYACTNMYTLHKPAETVALMRTLLQKSMHRRISPVVAALVYKNERRRQKGQKTGGTRLAKGLSRIIIAHHNLLVTFYPRHISVL